MPKLKIVVCGATGNQGSAVVAHLLKSGNWHVVALTRQLESPTSLALALLGAELVQADTAAQDSLAVAFRGAYGVFGLTQPWSAEERKYNVFKELIQGRNIIWACKAAGVRHLVFSSFFGVSNETKGVSFIGSKRKLEQIIRESELPSTVLRCGIYMDGINYSSARQPCISGNFSPYDRVPYISLDNIGRCVSMIFTDQAYLGKIINLAGDFKSGTEIAAMYAMLRNDGVCHYKPASALNQLIFKPDIYRLRCLIREYNQPFLQDQIEYAILAANRYFGALDTLEIFVKTYYGSIKRISE